MNPLTITRNITKLNEREIKLGVADKASWHSEYKDSAWIFVGGLPYELTEGDTICVFSQYGEIVNINLVRDKKTGKSKGYCFLCYEDQRSTVLAVDNFNGIKLLGRTIRVDHVANYRIPKDHDDLDETTKKIRQVGCGPNTIIDPGESDQNLTVPKDRDDNSKTTVKSGDLQKDKKTYIKQEVSDPGYDKYETQPTMSSSRSKVNRTSEGISRNETNRNSGGNHRSEIGKNLEPEAKPKHGRDERYKEDRHRDRKRSKHSSKSHRSHHHSSDSDEHPSRIHKSHSKHKK